MQGMAAPQIIEDLSQPAAYPFAVDRVEALQTHVSILFFAGERVYKVKKPVDFGFLDFSTLKRRRFFCGEEVRLNRRLAPDVYLGVVPILRGPDGRLRIGSDESDPVDYAVEMRRLPADRMLDRLLDEGVIDNTVIDDIVEVLVRFHATAATGPDVDRHGEPDAVRTPFQCIYDVHRHRLWSGPWCSNNWVPDGIRRGQPAGGGAAAPGGLCVGLGCSVVLCGVDESRTA